MFKQLATGMVVLLAGAVVAAQAGLKEDVQAAAKKLAAAPNYSWTQTIEGGGFGGGNSEGKTQLDGLSYLSMEMRGNTVEAFIKGKQIALKTEDDWQTLQEALSADTGGGPNPARR